MKTRSDTKISLKRTIRASSQTVESAKTSTTNRKPNGDGVKKNDTSVLNKERSTSSIETSKVRLNEVEDELMGYPQHPRPESGSKSSEILKCSSATPKSKFSSENLEDRTPLKDEVLFCSQQFDSQSGIGWDSNAVRYVRLNKGRRKNTDVSDIVNKLVVPDDERHNDIDHIGTPPMLGIWMDSAARNQTDSNNDEPYQNTRANRRRNKGKLLDDGGAMMELMEKLKLAMEKCSEDGSPKATLQNKRTKDTSETNSKDSDGMLAEMNISTDLFDSTNPQKVQMDKETSVKTLCKNSSSDLIDKSSKIGPKAELDNKSDTSWSDDDIFKDDSFIIKATQDPNSVMGSNRKQCSYKRKLENDRSDEPGAKTIKFDSKQSNRVNNWVCTSKRYTDIDTSERTVHSSRQTNRLMDNKQKDDRRILSPFRRHSSFNDSFDLKTESVNQNSASNNANSNSKSKLRKINSFSGPLTTSTPSKSKCSTSYQNTVKLMSPILENNSKSKSNLVHMKSSNSDVKQIGNSKSTNVGLKHNQFTQQRSWSLHNQQLNQKMSSTNTTRNNNIVNNTNSHASVLQKSKSSLTSKFKDMGVNRAYSEGLTNNQDKCTLLSPKGNSNKRCSGIFDSSLTDDLLCQLAEPDDILESQLSPESRKKTETKTTCDKNVSSCQLKNTKDVNAKCVDEKLKSDTVSNNMFKSANNPNLVKTKQVNKPVMGNRNTHHSQQNKPLCKPVINTGNVAISAKNKLVNNTAISTGNISDNANSNQINKPAMSDMPHNTQDITVNSSSITSSQVGKYRFKNRSPKGNSHLQKESMPSVPKGLSVKNPGTKTNIKSVTGDENAVKDIPCVKDKVLYSNSEDLFLSGEEDDELSEPQIIAMLETAEIQATQTSLKDAKNESTVVKVNPTVETKSSFNKVPNTSKSVGPVSINTDTNEKRNQCKQEVGIKCKLQCENGMKTGYIVPVPSSSQNNVKSPSKCTREEIERKKWEALQRKRKLSGGDGIIDQISSSPSNSQSSKSPFKCTPEEIEQKKREALQRRRKLSSGDLTTDHINSSPSSSQSNKSESPFKCTPEEIEKKKHEAFERKRLASGNAKMSANGPMCSPSSSQLHDSESPFKCSPEEIERKKRAALAKRKVLTGTDNSSVQPDPVKNQRILQEIERKKQAALKRRQERLKATQGSNSTVTQKPINKYVNR